MRRLPNTIRRTWESPRILPDFPQILNASKLDPVSISRLRFTRGAYKTPALPNGEEHNYFGRIKHLAKAKKLTGTKLTPYYEDGTYGKVSTYGELPKMVMPVAELEAVADFGSNNTTFSVAFAHSSGGEVVGEIDHRVKINLIPPFDTD